MATTIKARKRTAYMTRGSVRGNCGHTHWTLSGAARCLENDSKGCVHQGGYSDRQIVRADGEHLNEAEIDFLESIR